MEMKLKRQLKHNKKDMETRLDQKNRYRSSLEKLEYPVCQTGQSDFHRENPCSNYFPKNDLGHF
jgi:hypothetical protein